MSGGAHQSDQEIKGSSSESSRGGHRREERWWWPITGGWARETGVCKLQLLPASFHPKVVTPNHPARLSPHWTPKAAPAWELHGNHGQHKPQFTSPHSWFRNQLSSAHSVKADLPHKESLKQNKEARRSPGGNCRIWQSLLTGASQDFSSVTGCQKKMPI